MGILTENKMVVKIKPSDIRYSQDSITCRFSKGERIGKVLDDICNGKLKVTSFQWISVAKLNGNWVSRNNRRLWLFRQLERLGKCGEIPVEVIDSIEPRKLTTKNGGVSIATRGSPGGSWVHKPNSQQSDSATPYFCQFAESQKRSRSQVKQFDTAGFVEDPFDDYENYFPEDDDDDDSFDDCCSDYDDVDYRYENDVSDDEYW